VTIPAHLRRVLSGAAPAALAASLAACTVGPDFQKPTSWWNPTGWFSGAPKPPPHDVISQPVAEKIDPRWWEVFHDPELTSLESRVAGANLDVRTATIRLAESRYSLGITRAGLFPVADANGSWTYQKLSKEGALSILPGGSQTPTASQNNGATLGPQATQANGLGGNGAPPASASQAPGNSSLFAPFSLFQYGFDASWEIDFWGHVRRTIESGEASLQASAEDQRNTLLQSLAEMARDYVQLRGVQRSIEITENNLRTAQQSLRLTQERALGGVTTELDVANAAAQVETNASQIPNLQAQETQLINAIAFLLGQAPGSLQAELSAPHPIPPVPPTIAVGLPSELLRRRPDIREAEAQLHVATANVGVAVANFYPQVTLSGSASIQATMFKDLGSWAQANQWSFGPSVTLPIFQGGQLRATLELRQAQQQEAAISYQRTVLNALREVDDALSAYDAEQRTRNRLQQAVLQNRRAVSLAQDRYQQGVADFLQVLVAEQALLAAEQQFTNSTTSVSTDLVLIYKALGGGWEGAFPEGPLPSPPPVKDAIL
jgi:NodT family efflux transporter outer membrane factor (OMF) lipoprotein